MKILMQLGMLAGAMGLFSAPVCAQAPEDPVIKARGAKVLTQGVSDSDLPPVPRAISEPPPLPPPETHIKDTRGYRPSKTRKASNRKGKKSGTAKAIKGGKVSKSAPRTKTKAKASKKSSRRKK